MLTDAEKKFVERHVEDVRALIDSVERYQRAIDQMSQALESVVTTLRQGAASLEGMLAEKEGESE